MRTERGCNETLRPEKNREMTERSCKVALREVAERDCKVSLTSQVVQKGDAE